LFHNPVYEFPALVTAVHSGKPHYLEKTYAAISELYYWNNIHESIENYIKSCDECQRLGTLKKDDTELHPIPVILGVSLWINVISQVVVSVSFHEFN
jgi:hypothetical protein